MDDGNACGALFLRIYGSDSQDEELSYPLNSVERATLLRKMDDYCRQQTGQSLKDYSTGLMAEEEIALPTGPTL